MVNPWEKYCAYIKNVETVLLNNIKTVLLYWSNSVKDRDIFFQRLLIENNLDKESLELDPQCPINRLYNKYNEIIACDSFNPCHYTLEKIIKFRCFALTSLSFNDINMEIKNLFGIEHDYIQYTHYSDRHNFIDTINIPSIRINNNNYDMRSFYIFNKPNLINIIRSYQDNKVEKNNNSETIDVNDFTKEIRNKKLVYSYTSEFIYDYEHIKESKKELHNEFYIGYKYFKKSIDKYYIPQAVLIKNLK